ncbi:hypothetical protein VNO80_02712 [Phaseolus coccineus]|uniref:Uncharacterized protein n=1 Tax=Phaseolus coccineus TaxID=3886 RepID=A0AAN9NRX9_PHACN
MPLLCFFFFFCKFRCRFVGEDSRFRWCSVLRCLVLEFRAIFSSTCLFEFCAILFLLSVFRRFSLVERSCTTECPREFQGFVWLMEFEKTLGFGQEDCCCYWTIYLGSKRLNYHS